MDPAIGCLILLGVMALLFITELIPLAVTAMGGAIICGFLNLYLITLCFQGFRTQRLRFLRACLLWVRQCFIQGLRTA